MKQAEFEKLVASIKEAGAIRRGERQPARVTRFEVEDVKTVRGRLGKTQEQFAMMIGVSVDTLRSWEQGRRRPEGPARALLRVAAHNPQAVVEALSGGRRTRRQATAGR